MFVNYESKLHENVVKFIKMTDKSEYYYLKENAKEIRETMKLSTNDYGEDI